MGCKRHHGLNMSQPTKVIQKTTCGREILTKHRLLIKGIRYKINKAIQIQKRSMEEKQDNRENMYIWEHKNTKTIHENTNTQENNFMLYVSTYMNIKTNIHTNKITKVALYHGR